MNLGGYEILIGVTGGIAAYKTATLVSQLVQSGAGVTVIMTRWAQEFVGPATFEALTGRPVHDGMFRQAGHPLGPHITLAQRADLMCVAPATADFLGKTAHGLADDLLSTAILVFEGPCLLAPAMNTAMWAKPAVQRNVQQLQDDGYILVGPEEGWLSCRQQGAGRMAQPKELLDAVLAHLPQRPKSEVVIEPEVS